MPTPHQTCRSRSPIVTGAGLVAAGAIALLAGTAHAQDALGDGSGLLRPLDATPAQRAAAYRTRSFADELRFRNSVVTGTAPAGRSFRGDVGYTSPFEFRGDLGSNELYEFRRDSIYSGLGGVGIRGTDALQYQFALTTGQTVPSGLARSLSVPRAGVGASSFGVLNNAPASPGQPTTPDYLRGSPVAQVSNLRSTANFLATRDLQPSLLSTIRDRTGERFAVTASPLGGVRLESRTHAELIDPSFRAGDPTDRYAAPVQPRRTVAQPDIARATTPYDALTARLNDAAPTTRVPGTSAIPGANDPADPDVAAPDPRDLNPLDPTSAPGSEAFDPRPWWEQRLDTLRSELEDADNAALTDDAGAASTAPITPRMPEVPGSSGSSASPGAPGTDKDAGDAEPTPEELEAAARARPVFDAEALRLIRAARGEVDTLLPQVEGEVDAYAIHMAAAEKLIADKRYFDAEERYTSALAARPADPTARVGRVHAQIGAGLLLSGGQNLRLLLREHPELAAIRYDGSLLPSADRLEGAQIVMRDQLGIVGPVANEAALLLAYIGYQLDDPEQTRAALEWLAADNAVDKGGVTVEKVADPLAVMLEQLWLPTDDHADTDQTDDEVSEPSP